MLRGHSGTLNGPHTPSMQGRKETLSCLALRTRQETRSHSFVKGHIMPGHPTNPVGNRQAAASFCRKSHSSLKAEVGGTPILEPQRDTQNMSQGCAQKYSSVLAQVQETATARGYLPPLRSWLGPETRGREAGHVPGSGEAHFCPGYALLLCGARPEASAHISVSAGPPGTNQA